MNNFIKGMVLLVIGAVSLATSRLLNLDAPITTIMLAYVGGALTVAGIWVASERNTEEGG